jgi:hypothetical protein
VIIVVIIIMCDKKRNCLLINVAIPDGSGINTKEAEKLSWKSRSAGCGK